jgi:hypothetical protein
MMISKKSGLFAYGFDYLGMRLIKGMEKWWTGCNRGSDPKSKGFS